MRRPRITIQKWMVILAFLAVAFWAAATVGPDLGRRWVACRQESAWHAKIATTLNTTLVLRAKSAASTGMPVRDFTRIRQRLRYHTSMSRKYGRALYIPWEFYRLGDTLSPR